MPVLLDQYGRPLLVSSDKTGVDKAALAQSGLDLSKADQQTVDAEIAKRVRNQSASLTQVWDPRRGKPKPTSVTFDTLRMMGNRNEWCAAIVKTRINQIGKVDWAITPKDDDDSSPSTKKLCDEVTRLLKRPSMYGSRPHSRSWRQFIGEILRDLLVLDAGCIEKERNGRKWVVAMYPVDGATIQPNIDSHGGYHDDAYVQIVDGQVTARFGMEDLVYIMDNPQTDVRYAGYGFSPLEHLIVSITAELYASKYNASYFEKGAIPEGMINLGEDVAPEDVNAFRLYWMNEIMGKPWAIPIVGGKGVEWIPWRDSNKDMEYMEYQQWLLKKMCAVYQIAPQEVGELEDVNRSTASEQANTNETKSIEPILTLIEDFFEVEVVGEHGLGVGDLVKFEFDKEEDNEAETDQAFSIRVPNGAASRNEWRKAVNMEPSEDEGADMLLVAGQLNPLPTEQDAAVLGAAAQQQHEQEMGQQQQDAQNEQGFGNESMPWKPGDKNDPDVQGAQMAHDTKAGLGPKQMPVGKSYDVKAVPYDRDPALTDTHDEFEDIFEKAAGRLAAKLERLLSMNIETPSTEKAMQIEPVVAKFIGERSVVNVQPTPVEIHIPAPEVNVAAPTVHVHPDIDVNVPEQPAPSVTVENRVDPTPVTVQNDIAAPTVTVENKVEPTPVTIENHVEPPSRTRVVRDQYDRIVGVEKLADDEPI